MRKRTILSLSLALMVFFALFGASYGHAEAQNTYPDGPLRVGLQHDYPPFSVVGPGGRPYGLLVDLWDLWSEATGVEVRFVLGSASQTLLALQNGKIDVHSGLADNSGLDEWLIFSQPLQEVLSALYLRAGAPLPANIDALAGNRVAVLAGSSQEAYLRRKYPDIEVVPVVSVEAMVGALLGGEAYAILAEVPSLEAELARKAVQGAVVRAPGVALRDELKAAVLKNRDDLLRLVNQGFQDIPLERIMAAELRWLSRSEDRYFTKHFKRTEDDGLGLTPEEQAWIEAHPQISMAIMDAWPPLDFQGPEGEPIGIGVDIIGLLSERTGLDIRIVPGQFKDNLEAVRDKNLDALMDVSPKPEREEYVNFTRDYLTVPHVFVGRADGPYYASEKQLSGKRVAIEKGFYTVDYLREKYPQVEVVEYANTSECLAAVSRGEAEAYLGNRAVALYLMSRELLTNLKVMGKSSRPGSVLAVGVRKDWPELASILDKALADISSGEMNAILLRWTGTWDEGVMRVELTPEQRAWVESHPVIKVAATPDWPPFEFEDSSGQHTGVSIDVFQVVLQRVGLEADFVVKPWPELYKMLKSGELDMSPSMTPTVPREEYFVFTKPFISSFMAIWVGQDIEDVRTVADLDGKVVAVEDGYFTSDLLADKFPGVGQLVAPSTIDALKAVSTGRADAYLGTHAVAAYLIDRYLISGLKLVGYMENEPMQLAFGVRKDLPMLRDILQRGLDSLSDGDIQDIQDRYLRGGADFQMQLRFTEEEQAWLDEHKDIRLGVDTAWLPFEGLSEDGEYLGVVSEYVAWLNDTLGVSMKPMAALSWSQALERIKHGGVDVIPGLTRTEEREQYLNFTRPYLSMPLVLVTQEDAPFVGGLEDLQGRTVAVIQGYVSQDYVERDHPGVTVVPVDSLAEGLKEVLQGDVDAFMDSLGAITYTIRTMDLKGLKVAATTPYTFDLAFAVRKDWPELATILDKALASIPRETRQSFSDRWVNVRVASRVDWGAVWRIGLIVAGVALFILAMFFWWNRKLAGEIAERKQAEKALSEALERNRGILASMGEGLFGVDSDGNTTFVNPAAAAMLDFAPEELKGKSVHDLIHHSTNDGSPYPEDECPMNLAYVRGKPYKVTNELLWRRDGSSFPVEYTASPLRLGGKVTGAVVAFRDITERLEAEQTVRAVREELQQIFDNAQVGILLLQGGRRVTRCNARFARIFGYDSPKEVVGSNISQFHVSKENFAHFSREHFPALRQGRQVQVEYAFNKRKDGSQFWSSMTGRALDPNIPPDLRKGLIWVIDDITDRKQAEAQLEAARKQLQLILDTSPVGVAFSSKGTLKFVNPTFKEMFGVDAEASTVPLYHDPNERERLLERITREGYVHNHEVRMVDASGEVRDMLANFQPLELVGEQGVLVWVLDITERKQAEEKVRESEHRFRGYFEHSQIGMGVTSPEKGWLEVNPQLERMFDYSLDELRAMTWAEITYPEDLQEDVDNFERMLAGELDAYSMDKRFLRKDGELVYTNMSVSCLRDDKGGVTLVLASFLDITDRKKAEDEIHRNLEELERFSKVVIGREERMIQLKEEINELMSRLGLEAKYKIVE